MNIMKKKLPSSSMLMAAVFFGVVLPMIPACSGGCGDEPSAKDKEQPSTGASSTGGGGGGGSNPQQLGGKAGASKGVGAGAKGTDSRFDSTNGKSGATNAMGQAGETAGQNTEAAGPIAPVSPTEFRGKILRQGATVFLSVISADCLDCDTVMPVLNTLAPDFSASFDFYRYDGNAVAASGMLPKGLSLSPLPAFAMYKNGKVTSVLQGMPFPQQVDASGNPTETQAQYQARLLRWFRDALTQRNLSFSRTIKKKAAKKD
jgi:hypothetical protein